MQSAALLWPFTAQLRSRRCRRQIVRLRSAGWCRRLSGASGGVGQARCAGGARRIVAQIAISKNLKPKETLTYTHVHTHTQKHTHTVCKTIGKANRKHENCNNSNNPNYILIKPQTHLKAISKHKTCSRLGAPQSSSRNPLLHGLTPNVFASTLAATAAAYKVLLL